MDDCGPYILAQCHTTNTNHVPNRRTLIRRASDVANDDGESSAGNVMPRGSPFSKWSTLKVESGKRTTITASRSLTPGRDVRTLSTWGSVREIVLKPPPGHTRTPSHEAHGHGRASYASVNMGKSSRCVRATQFPQFHTHRLPPAMLIINVINALFRSLCDKYNYTYWYQQLCFVCAEIECSMNWNASVFEVAIPYHCHAFLS